MTRTEAELLAVYGTPKAGVRCGRCGDWGTVVISRGHTSYEELCPAEDCEAAERRARVAQNQLGAERD